MADTAARVRDDILGLLGLEALSHGPATLETRILSDLNRALQEIYSLHPRLWIATDPRAEQVRAPLAVTLDVTNGSKTIANLTSASWMTGCTIVISGDAAQNMLIKTAGVSLTLLKPYQGPNGATVAATVYQDVVQPGADVEQVLAPVMAEGYGELRPVAHERDRLKADTGNFSTTDHGRDTSTLYPLAHSDRPVRMPDAYLCERQFDSTEGSVVSRLRFSALPDRAFVLSFRVKLIGGMAGVTTLSDTRELVPFNLVDSVLLPIVRFRFSSWPHFTGDAAALKADYEGALAMLGNLNPPSFTEQRIACGDAW